MGLKRGLWRSTGIGRTIDTVKNIVDEGSISGGVKKDDKRGLDGRQSARKDDL